MRRILITLMLILVIIPVLVAADAGYDVLVYPRNDEVEAFILGYFPGKEFNESTWEMLTLREKEAGLQVLGQDLKNAYGSENAEKIAAAQARYADGPDTEIPSGKTFSVNLVDNKGMDYDIEAMKTDPVLLKYICDTSGADLIVMPVSDYLQGFRLLSIYVYEYGSDSAKLIHQAVSTDSDRFPVSAALSMAGCFMNSSPALVRMDNLAVGTVVEVDGTEAKVLDGYVMTTEGRHVFRLSALGKQDRTFASELEGNVVSSLDASMKDERYSGLKIESDPQAEVYIDGVSVGLTPLMLDNYVIPSSLRFKAPGYSDKTVGVLKETKGISISLKPEWMADEKLFRSTKDGFYTRFAVCLVVFGAKIAMKTLDNGSGKLLGALDGIATAALTVSFADLIGSLVDYYRQTEYIAP